MNSTNYFFNLPRATKRGIALIFDACALAFSFFIAFISHPSIGDIGMTNIVLILMPSILLSVGLFIKYGMYRAIFRYSGIEAYKISFGCIIISISITYIVAKFMGIKFPFGFFLSYFAYTLILIGGARMILRNMVFYKTTQNAGIPVLIYGAGSAGRQLNLALKHSKEYRPVSYIDDDSTLHHSTLQGLQVKSVTDIDAVISEYGIQKVLLAIPSASVSQRKKILVKLEHLHIQVLTIPGAPDIIDGKYKVDQLKQVDITDLLGRESVTPDVELMARNIGDKVVMVTGAGGSIGSELCRQIINQKPTKLVLFEHSEFNLYSIEKELREYITDNSLTVELIPLMGSVQFQSRLISIMDTFKVETVYHAAAYKHVPLVEHNVVDGVRNNIFGTLYTARAAIAANVSNFVLISTDKAVRPTNVMGTTKRMAELVLQALSKQSHNTRFCMVRFGNVLGSSGSVVPLFKKQIAEGGPVTLTDKNITRYFMTIPEAAQLVIQAGAMGKGGDVFVLDMGKSIKIYDLAANMIHLSGFDVKGDHNPNGDIEIKITGLRPGEKLYEELLIGDNVEKTDHSRIMTANEVCLTWPELEQVLAKLEIACQGFDNPVIRELLLAAPTGFAPKDDICDLVWNASQAET